MQNLGFAFSMIPMIEGEDKSSTRVSEFLLRHLQLFNTHPYFSASILGSVARAEEELRPGQDGAQIVQLKNTLMAPYAAIGDAFFWGSWRPFVAIVAVTLSLLGFSWAPVVFLVLYNPLHLWIRWQGFRDGYRLGNRGVQFVQALNLPALNPWIRWSSVAVLALLTFGWLEVEKPALFGELPGTVVGVSVIGLILLSSWATGRHVSSVVQLYGLAMVFFLFSL